jgi:hypothetical protein
MVEAGGTDRRAGFDRARGERDLAAGRFAGCYRPSSLTLLQHSVDTSIPRDADNR